MSSVLILGGTSDVAIAAARKYASHKYDVMMASRKPEQLNTFCTELADTHSVKVWNLAFDAEDMNNHRAFVDQLPELPEIALCVFGYLGDQKTAELEWSEASRILNVNFVGAASILNVIALKYETFGTGTIVGISSVAGERGRQSNYFYGSAKAGFTAYLSGLRNRLTRAGVHVVTVKPGFIRTRMTAGMKLPGPITASPEQVANAIYSGARSKSNVVYVLPVWRLIMAIIRNIPEFIFKRMKL